MGPAGIPSSPESSHTTHRLAERKGVAGTEVNEVGKVAPTGSLALLCPWVPFKLLSSGLWPLTAVVGGTWKDMEPG